MDSLNSNPQNIYHPPVFSLTKNLKNINTDAGPPTYDSFILNDEMPPPSYLTLVNKNENDNSSRATTSLE